MTDLPDRSAIWLRILDSLIRTPDLLGTNTVDDVVKMADRFEQAHEKRFSPSGRSGDPEPPEPPESMEDPDAHWSSCSWLPPLPDPGVPCPGCGASFPTTTTMKPSKIHGGQAVCPLCTGLDTEATIVEVCARWSKGGTGSPHRLMCLKEIRRKLPDLDASEARELMKQHWPVPF